MGVKVILKLLGSPYHHNYVMSVVIKSGLWTKVVKCDIKYSPMITPGKASKNQTGFVVDMWVHL